MRVRFLGRNRFRSVDSFDRANGGVNVGNPLWTNLAGDTMPQISGNNVLLGAPVTNRAFLSNTPANLKTVFSRLTYISQAGGAFSVAGPTVFESANNAAQNWYGAMSGNNGGGNDQLFIVRSVAGAQTILAQSAAGARVPGTQEIRAVVTPTQVTLFYFQNGVQVLTAVDALGNRLTTGACGMQMASGDGVRVQTFNDFVCGTIGGGGLALYFTVGRAPIAR